MAWDDDAADIIAQLETALAAEERKSQWLEEELTKARDEVTDLKGKLAAAVRSVSILQDQVGEAPY